MQLLFAASARHFWNCHANFLHSWWLMRCMCFSWGIFQRTNAYNCGDCFLDYRLQYVRKFLLNVTLHDINFTIIKSYYILGAIFGNANIPGQYFNTLEFITFFSYQIAVHFLSVVAIVYVSSAVSKESEKTAICVHKLLNVTKSEALKIQLNQLSMQLLHRKVKFTACNLFTLDTSLIFTVR